MELKLNRKADILAVDTTVIATKKNSAADILFLQITKEGSQPEADVVAAVRLTSIDELKDLNKTIEESIRKHETAER